MANNNTFKDNALRVDSCQLPVKDPQQKTDNRQPTTDNYPAGDPQKYQVELLGMDVKIGKILSAELRAKAHRPKYSVLDNNNLKAIGLDNMPSWKEALKAYLIEKGHII